MRNQDSSNWRMELSNAWKRISQNSMNATTFWLHLTSTRVDVMQSFGLSEEAIEEYIDSPTAEDLIREKFFAGLNTSIHAKIMVQFRDWHRRPISDILEFTQRLEAADDLLNENGSKNFIGQSLNAINARDRTHKVSWQSPSPKTDQGYTHNSPMRKRPNSPNFSGRPYSSASFTHRREAFNAGSADASRKWNHSASGHDNDLSPNEARHPPKRHADYPSGRRQQVHSVERILRHKRERGQVLYLVKLEGHPDSENTWATDRQFENDKTLQEYWNSFDGTVHEEDVPMRFRR